MKKLLCILLALTLICALFVGCGKKDEANEPANDPADKVEENKPADDNAENNEPADEPADEPRSIGFVLMGMGNEFFQGLADTFTEYFTEAGWENHYVSGEFDPTVQMEAIENFTAMGLDVIIVHPVSGAALNAVVDTARDAGIKVIIMVDPTNNWDGLLSSDNVATGMANAWMCAQWVEEHYPDAEPRSIPVALLTNTASYDSTQAAEGMRRIEEFSDKLYVAVEYELTGMNTEDGMEAAENLYTTNPEITLFVTSANMVSTGINNFYTGMNSPVDDLSNYGTWGTNASGEALQAIKASQNNESMFRGVNIQSGYQETVQCMMELASGLLDGTIEKGEIPANVYLVDASNVDTWMADGWVNFVWDMDNDCGTYID